MNKETIAFVVGFFPYAQGGAELQSYQIAQSLKSEFDVHFLSVCDEVSDLHRKVVDGMTIWLLPKRVFSRKIFGHDTFLNYWMIRKIFAKIRPRYVYQRCASFDTWICARLKKEYNYRFVFHVANDADVVPVRRSSRYYLVYKTEQYFVRKAVAAADVVFVQNEFQKSGCSAFFHRNDVRLVYNFSYGESVRPVKSPDKIVVCWVANLKPIKNPYSFARIAHAFASDSRFVFYMIGTPLEEKDMSYIYEVASENKNFHFLGRLSNEDVNKYLSMAHVLVNTSYKEGFSNVFVQAWFRGCAVASLYANPDNLLEKYDVGFFANGDEGKVIDFLCRFADDPSLRQYMWANAVEFAESHFSAEVILPIIKQGIIGYESSSKTTYHR